MTASTALKLQLDWMTTDAGHILAIKSILPGVQCEQRIGRGASATCGRDLAVSRAVRRDRTLL
jgi:hypothetical protein